MRGVHGVQQGGARARMQRRDVGGRTSATAASNLSSLFRAFA
jgi:hypothetical protein